MPDKYMKVQRIEHGTVIDHIPPGKAFDVLSVLGISNERSMSILINSQSKKGDRKDILKVEDVELSGEEANRVALVAPNATINIIREGEVFRKFKVEAPKVVRGILTCSNPNCISNQREPVTSEFRLGEEEPHRYVCVYCERDIVDLAKRVCS